MSEPWMVDRPRQVPGYQRSSHNAPQWSKVAFLFFCNPDTIEDLVFHNPKDCGSIVEKITIWLQSHNSTTIPWNVENGILDCVRIAKSGRPSGPRHENLLTVRRLFAIPQIRDTIHINNGCSNKTFGLAKKLHQLGTDKANCFAIQQSAEELYSWHNPYRL